MLNECKKAVKGRVFPPLGAPAEPTWMAPDPRRSPGAPRDAEGKNRGEQESGEHAGCDERLCLPASQGGGATAEDGMAM
eukprot:5003208-Pyramimonas_sp.AAC.1